MRNLSAQFRRALYNNDRRYLAYADITLKNNVQLNLTNTQIWANGFSFEDAVSDDNSFTALGSAIIGSASVIINNMNQAYSDYDFTGAEVILYIGQQFDQTLEKIRIGTYTVDDTAYNGGTITLSLLDNMEQFDRPYSNSTLTYPATLDMIVRDACECCGVYLATLDFPHKTFTVNTRPDDDSTTFREVISWAATIAGCFCKCNAMGQLELKWFDTALLTNYDNGLDGGVFDSSTPYSSGDAADGGTFNPWNTGYEYDAGEFGSEPDIHFINGLKSQNICVDDTVITNVSIAIKDDDGVETIYTPSGGTSGYVIQISDNEFITSDNAQTVVNWLGTQLIGLRFRKLSVSHLNDPSIEAGDVAVVIDRKNNEYSILVTRQSFAISTYQTVVCGASTPSRNSATRYSQAVKNYVESRKLFKTEKTLREQQEENLRTAIANASGLYYREEPDPNDPTKKIYYLHDKSDFASSNIRMMFSDAGIVLTPNKGQSWYGLDVNGNMLVNLLSTVGISFDWARGGTLQLGGQNNQNGLLIIYNASGAEVVRGDNNGLLLSNAAQNTSGGPITFRFGKFTANAPGHDNAVDQIGCILTNTDSRDPSWLCITKFIDNSWMSTNPQTDVNILASHNLRIMGGVKTFSSKKQLYISDDSIQIRDTVPRIACIGNAVTIRDNSVTISASSASPTVIEFGLSVTGGNLTVSGTKSRNIETADYADRLLYCYETASPMFGDIGEGTIGEDGLCYISIDPIFEETINTQYYQVFLQKYGEGECYVKERNSSYFIVAGTPNLSFGWELKAKQIDCNQIRLEKNDNGVSIDNVTDYANDALTHIQKIQGERELV